MGAGAGRFRDIAVFEIRGGAEDQYGNPDTVWETYARRHVEIIERPVGESLEGGVLQSHTRATIHCRRDAVIGSVPTDARVRLRGSNWSIRSIAETTRGPGRNRDLYEITLDRGPAT